VEHVMQITDIPEFKDRGHVLALPSGKTVFDAVKEMKNLNYGAVVVTKNNKIAGIFTERDLLIRVVGEGKDPKKTKVEDVMTTGVKTAKVTDDITDSMRRMSSGRFRHLPIVDDGGKLTGMLSQGDFVAITWPQLIHQFTTQAKASFFSHTQLWMLLLVIIGYITFFKLFF
jgi:signal-transduction protein with cAMP-binding, CBS, and nucleotidyltransferase domain